MLPATQPDEFERLTGALEAFGLGNALHFESPGGVLLHCPVGEQPEVLEDHRGLLTPELNERLVVVLENVLAVKEDLAERRLDQADQGAGKGGLAAA